MFIVRRFYKKNFVSDFVFNIQVISGLPSRYSVCYVFLTFFLKLFDGQNALYMSKGITDSFFVFPTKIDKNSLSWLALCYKELFFNCLQNMKSVEIIFFLKKSFYINFFCNFVC